jgi:hypothetical protein
MRELRRLAPGVYVTADGRYRVERQDGLTECEHPMCDVLHQKFITHQRGGGWVHYTSYVAWHIWDDERGDYATAGPEEFDTKREAAAWLHSHLTAGAATEWRKAHGFIRPGVTPSA